MSVRLRVGLSGKNDTDGRLYEPLSHKTNSGKIVKKLQETLPGVSHMNINLVSHAPLDSEWVLRYPTSHECQAGLHELITQLQTIKPDKIIALGKQVQHSLSALHNEYTIIDIPHPSYIFRKQKTLLSEISVLLSNV